MAVLAPNVPAGNLIDFYNGTFDWDTHTFNVALFNNSYVTTTLTYSTTNELATSNGYTQGGVALTNQLSEAAGTVTYDHNAADPNWTASGGDLGGGAFRYAVIYRTTDNNIAFFIDLDDTPGTVTVNDGNTFTLQFNASGVWTSTEA